MIWFRLYDKKVIQIVLRKRKKLRIVQYLNYSNCFIQFIRSGSNWCQIGNKACYILKVCKFYVEKGYTC